jgi:hypothetical protein
MKPKSGMMLRVLLNRFHKGPPDALLAVLPKEEAAEIAKIRTQSKDLDPFLALPGARLSRIHYSWMVPIVQSFSRGMQPILLSALPEPHSSRLSKLLRKQSSQTALNPLFKNYLLGIFYAKLQQPEMVPWEMLPPTPMTMLGQLGKPKLVELIDFIGIYDLASEIRHVVDKRYLERFYLCLTPKKQHFLRVCLNQKEKLATPRLELEGWRGDCTQLAKILHRRGLLRLAGALSGQHPDLIWHICHIFDTGRGTFLQKHVLPEEVPHVTHVLGQQVASVISFLKNKR